MKVTTRVILGSIQFSALGLGPLINCAIAVNNATPTGPSQSGKNRDQRKEDGVTIGVGNVRRLAPFHTSTLFQTESSEVET